MAGWNALFLAPAVETADASRSAVWRRGSELVNGLGHCGACHTERNALGAERRGAERFGGASVEGWYGPALTTLSRGPVPWSEEALFRYLRDGHSPRHGSANGPMADVVRELAGVPDADVRAMAHYLASFNPPADEARDAALAAAAVERSRTIGAREPGVAQRRFASACGACHHDGDGPAVFGQNIPLALSSKLHADTPDNLLRVLLDGVREPATRELGYMPAFRDAFDDAQVAELAAYLRARHAPDAPAWTGLAQASARIRAAR